ncbi:MAG TPA: GNAT family N-acetyltransferase [Dehalococcoidia bacterium]|jgi:predicted acetyltransferase|nr:GNAT family N-acetyltransferase [Dehalococcoidia bacterium]
MAIEVRQVTAADEALFRRLYQLYVYDFTEFTAEDIGPDGQYPDPGNEAHWGVAGFDHFLAFVDGYPAGLAIVGHASTISGDTGVFDMTQFFVLRKYRRRRVGEEFARAMFDRYRGRWEVRERRDNLPAQAFWRAIIGRYTGGRFTERSEWQDRPSRGPVQFFDSSEPDRG